MKTCSTCKEQKPLDQFCRDRTKRDGMDPRCSACRKIEAARSYRNNSDAAYGRMRAWRAKHPDRRPAHRAVQSAIERGDMIRQPCRVCGNPKADAHHDDYTKPLEVDWLCRLHHIARHKELDATA
jgi:hypothetical protein